MALPNLSSNDPRIKREDSEGENYLTLVRGDNYDWEHSTSETVGVVDQPGNPALFSAYASFLGPAQSIYSLGRTESDSRESQQVAEEVNRYFFALSMGYPSRAHDFWLHKADTTPIHLGEESVRDAVATAMLSNLWGTTPRNRDVLLDAFTGYARLEHELATASALLAARDALEHETEASREEFVQRCLHDLDADAHEKGIEVGSGVRGEVERLLCELTDLPDDASVIADEGGSAEIEVFRIPHGAFVLRCEPGRRALCVVSVDRFRRRARYQNSRMLPDGFVNEGLASVLQHR